MTPELLAKYLEVMRANRVMSGVLSLEGGVVINVAFGPDAEPMPGDKPTPGGWKGPERLDAPSQFDEAP